METEYIDARLILSLRPTGPTGKARAIFGTHFWLGRRERGNQGAIIGPG